MKADIEIAQACNMVPIGQIAAKLGLQEEHLELYGKYKAKLPDQLLETLKDKKDGKLILVTAINPTPAGEGKTTTTVGLGQALHQLRKSAMVVLREPSLGPVMGVKGGAAGGGYAQVVPMEDINLHFTGDMHAITTANNLLSAIIDNHIHQGNELMIDPRQIIWKRAMDMNDRALRQIVVGLGGKLNGFPREDGFLITVASEIMAILCLSSNLMDLKTRLGKIIVAYNDTGEPVTAADLKADGAMTLLLKDAIKPNLVQTLENSPAMMHGGPFANIAHGCNSIIATKLSLKLSDYVITEAGFGTDLGAEKFFNIKCRYAGLTPDAVVLVATIRALKYNGGVAREYLKTENLSALKKGVENLHKHLENLQKFNVPVLVALNHFDTDTEAELSLVTECCKRRGVRVALSRVFSCGGEGGIELANSLLEILETEKSGFRPLYDLTLPIEDKIAVIVKEIYGGKDVSYTSKAEKSIQKIKAMGYANLPVCMAKTQYSLSDQPKLLGRPKDFTVTVREVYLSAGAGFIVAIAGDIMTMLGLPKTPSAERIDIDAEGHITGLF